MLHAVGILTTKMDQYKGLGLDVLLIVCDSKKYDIIKTVRYKKDLARVLAWVLGRGERLWCAAWWRW